MPPKTEESTAHIPIDPALQAQSQPTASSSSAYYPYSHYPQAAYSGHYAYGGAQTQTTTQTQTSNSRSTGGGGDDLATLNDALGSAGVDLRAEEESLHRSSQATSHSYSYRPNEDRTRQQALRPAFDTALLGQAMRTIAAGYKLGTTAPAAGTAGTTATAGIAAVPADCVTYLALALRFRLQELIEGMIKAAKHRKDGQFDRAASFYEDPASENPTPIPMWSILLRSDTAKQLAALEKVEREEEIRVRRERKERADLQAQVAALASAATNASFQEFDGSSPDDAGGSGGGGKKKKKKDGGGTGPGVTAKNMSEDVRKKMSNAVASQAAGLRGSGRYAWMTGVSGVANNAAGGKKKEKEGSPAPSTPAASGGGGWAKPYVSSTPGASAAATASPVATTAGEDARLVITLRDAMFVVGKERGHGGGKGSARGWT